MTTLRLSLPAAAAENASTARASANGPAPRTLVARSPVGRATSPTRMTCAPPTVFDPVGFRAVSASLLAAGRSVPFESRIGARTVVPARTAAATPTRQSRPSARTTAPGRVDADVAGKTARAAPAASATGSAPPTRVVFFVANAGKPRPVAASGSVALAPGVGAVTVLAGTARSPLCPPQAAARPDSARTASRSARRRISAGRYRPQLR